MIMGASVSKSNLPRPKIEIASKDDIESQVWGESMCFTSYGVRVGIRVNREGVLDRILPHLPPGWKRSRSLNVDRMYSFVIGAKGQVGKLRRLNLVYADDNRIAGTPKLHQATDAFESDLQLFVAETAPRRVFVHAGVVALRGRAILIPGRSFSGKTSLGGALVKPPIAKTASGWFILNSRLAAPYDFLNPRRNAISPPRCNPIAGNVTISIPDADFTASWSTSFGEISSVTTQSRCKSFSATDSPGNRWPPVPPHAIAIE